MSMGEKSSKSIDSHPYPTLRAASWGASVFGPSFGIIPRFLAVASHSDFVQSISVMAGIAASAARPDPLALRAQNLRKHRPTRGIQNSKLDQSESPMLGN